MYQASSSLRRMAGSSDAGDSNSDWASLAMLCELIRWAQTVDLGKLPSSHPRRGVITGGRER